MSKKLYPEESVQAIATAIRAKNGSSDTYKISQMAEAIGNIPSGSTNIVSGTFTSASEQYGIVDIDCGFEPDMVIVSLPFDGVDTTSYWERNISWADEYACWNLYPAEGVVYFVELDREYGETGIQAINDDGFSFMSNGWNTLDVTCNYVAVKY